MSQSELLELFGMLLE